MMSPEMEEKIVSCYKHMTVPSIAKTLGITINQTAHVVYTKYGLRRGTDEEINVALAKIRQGARDKRSLGLLSLWGQKDYKSPINEKYLWKK